jgi:dihydroorotate dehydrogenase (fumarate)
MIRPQNMGDAAFEGLPIMIGAGVCKDPVLTQKWLKVAPVVSGSYTMELRSGNGGDSLFYPDTLEAMLELGYGLNSFGAKNDGVEAALNMFGENKFAHPLIISVAGFSIEDYVLCVEAVSKCIAVSAIELNLSCPNTEHGKIFSFDLAILEELFKALAPYNQKPLWVKLSPYSDPGQLTAVATLISNYRSTISAVVTCNTFPSAYAGASAISPHDGLAGLSGPALKPISLGQVRQFRQQLHPDIAIIGVGGITTGNDVQDFLEAGANAVQVTSLPFWLGEPQKFWDTLLSEEERNNLSDLGFCLGVT